MNAWRLTAWPLDKKGKVYIILFIRFNYEVTIFNTPHFLKEYYASYKRWLARLLGRDTISNVYSLIFMLIILLWIVSVLLFLSCILLPLLYMFSEPLYCMDDLTEGRNELLAKITKAEGKIEYFSEQAKETDLLFKEALRDNLPEVMKEERLEAKRDSESNLNLERKVLRVLKARLDSGNFDSSLATSSSLGKRNFGE